MTSLRTLAITFAASALLLGGCNAVQHVNQWEDVTQAVAVMHPIGGSGVSGTVRFSDLPNGKVHVVADIQGLSPNGTHAIHVHEYGDCTAADGTSAGGHYNPDDHHHALPTEDTPRHAGDFGNLVADASGRAHMELDADNITVAGMVNPVIGRAVIIHAKADQGVAEQPTGAAGGRIACGVIGVANPTMK